LFSSLMIEISDLASSASSLPSQFGGGAVQNPGLPPAKVTVSLFADADVLLGSSTVPIPSGYRMMRESYELTGSTATPGCYAVVTASEPVQVFGLLADSATLTITPLAAAIARW
jgi:hypothetical protein